MHLPTVEQLDAELDALRKEFAANAGDTDAVVEQVAKLRMLAVYLNADLTAPEIEQE